MESATRVQGSPPCGDGTTVDGIAELTPKVVDLELVGMGSLHHSVKFTAQPCPLWRCHVLQ